jgi:hypothetical protein
MVSEEVEGTRLMNELIMVRRLVEEAHLESPNSATVAAKAKET